MLSTNIGILALMLPLGSAGVWLLVLLLFVAVVIIITRRRT